ncbi:hypothetical protein MAR_006372 [Mya arenaria]|uniref:Uncharacterized protein n=1 Tax=Mya arenaria TaxID=6604 RepID=A0ABY7D897_MYAAR|nr:hypothetical protein MAR_006372 [Mya arenaria]
MLESKRSVIQIRNTDELCCARAVATAIARLEKHPQWGSIRKGTQLQKIMAVELHEKAEVPMQKCEIEEVTRFQAILSQHQIHVLSKEYFNGIIYAGPDGASFVQPVIRVIQTRRNIFATTLVCTAISCILIKKKNGSSVTNATDIFRKIPKSEGGKSLCEVYFKCKDCDQTINKKKHKSCTQGYAVGENVETVGNYGAEHFNTSLIIAWYKKYAHSSYTRVILKVMWQERTSVSRAEDYGRFFVNGCFLEKTTTPGPRSYGIISRAMIHTLFYTKTLFFPKCSFHVQVVDQ